DRLDVEVHDNRLAIASNEDAFEHLVRTGVYLLMRHEGWHKDEIAGSGLRGELEPFAPTHARPAFHHVNDAFQRPVVMRSRLGVGVNVDRSRPKLLCPDTGEGDCGLPVHARRLRGVWVQFHTGDHTHAVMFPAFVRCHWLSSPFLSLRSPRAYPL